VNLTQLGRAKRIEVTRESCWITGGNSDPRSVAARASGIRQQIEVEKGDYDIERLQMRLAMLVGKICSIRVGGASSLDRAERMYKLQTAMHSARAALVSGVVPGGGATFFHARHALTGESEARDAVRVALEAPLKQQIANARLSEGEVLTKIDGAAENGIGFDAESRQVRNLEEIGVLDPTRVCIEALKLAFVHARAILQTGVWDLTDRTPQRVAGPRIVS
jgi:chaperonin GroEL